MKEATQAWKRSFYGLNQYWTNHIIPCNCFTCGLSHRIWNCIMNLTVMHHPDLVSVAIGKILQYDPYENFSLIITDSYKRKIVSFRRLFHPVSCLHKTSWFSLFPRDPRTERLVCTDQGKFFHRGPGSPWIPAFPYPVFENFPYPNWISFGFFPMIFH